MKMPRPILSFECSPSVIVEVVDRRSYAAVFNKLLVFSNDPSFAATSPVYGYHFFCENGNSINSTFPAALVTVTGMPLSVADDGKAACSSPACLFAATAVTSGISYVVNLAGIVLEPAPSVNRKNKSEQIVRGKNRLSFTAVTGNCLR